MLGTDQSKSSKILKLCCRLSGKWSSTQKSKILKLWHRLSAKWSSTQKYLGFQR